jgi:hypothetical protein
MYISLDFQSNIYTVCYDLNFHPVSHGVTVSCERYTMGFPVCYGSQKHHECKEGESRGRW